jgi:hypothetical protein
MSSSHRIRLLAALHQMNIYVMTSDGDFNHVDLQSPTMKHQRDFQTIPRDSTRSLSGIVVAILLIHAAARADV